MDFQSLPISPAHLSILLLLLSGMGKALKSIPAFPNHLIPFTLCLTGFASNGWMNGFDAEQSIIGGAVGLTSVGLHQMLRAALNHKADDR